MNVCMCRGIRYLQSALQTPLPFVRISLALLPGVFGRETVGEKEEKDETEWELCSLRNLRLYSTRRTGLCAQRERGRRRTESKWLTSTSPVRSLYLSRMIGSAGFSFRVLERSLKGCSGAGEGMDRTISFSPRLWLRLWEPLYKYMGKWQMGVSTNMKQKCILFVFLWDSYETLHESKKKIKKITICKKI